MVRGTHPIATSPQPSHLSALITGITPSEGVVILASTNRESVLDQALLRPGRFDRQIMVSLPTLPERKAIFEVYLGGIVLEKQVNRYSSRLAALTPGHSGEYCLWTPPHFPPSSFTSHPFLTSIPFDLLSITLLLPLPLPLHSFFPSVSLSSHISPPPSTLLLSITHLQLLSLPSPPLRPLPPQVLT